jgi:hypothetical protein
VPYWGPIENDTPTVAELISYIADQVISQVTSATRPPGTFGQFIAESDTGRVYGHSGAAFVQFGGLTAAALNAHTPTIDQGATTNITKTTVYSQWQRYGNVALWTFSFIVTGTGTAGSNVTLTTPVTMTTTSTGLGGGRFWDTSATIAYHGLWLPATTTTIRLYVDTNIGNSAWGIAPNVPLGNGDTIAGSVLLPIA